MHYILLFLNISGTNLVQKCCLEFTIFEKILLVFVEYPFHVIIIIIIIVVVVVAVIVVVVVVLHLVS